MEFIFVPLFVILTVAKYTWWFIVPVVLWPLFKDLWRWWRVVTVYAPKADNVLLEIKPPPDVIRTPKAMEIVLAGIHGSWQVIKWKDKWMNGEMQTRYSLEIVGIDGRMHFYIRTPRKFRNLVESKIYAQYPEAEISEAEDYTEMIPPNVPTKEWTIWGTDMKFDKEDAYPIRIYEEFEDIEEERRIDPLASLAEFISQLKDGEQIWIQFVISPVLAREWTDKSHALVDKFMERKGAKKKDVLDTLSEFVSNGFRVMFRGEAPMWGEAEESGSKEQLFIFKLTKGEQETIYAIEQKAGKPAFQTAVRILYVARREAEDRAAISAVQGYFRQYTDQNLNGLSIRSESKPSSNIILFQKFRNYRRLLRIFRLYKGRMFNFLYGHEPIILDIRELASLYHFPGRVVSAPGMHRVESKKGVPPSGLPIE